MKKFIINCALLGIPFVIYGILVAIIDPYNYRNMNKGADRQMKEDIAYVIEPHLLRMTKFHNNPTDKVVLGDSRSNGLYVRIESCDSVYKGWSNLAYGGSSLQEVIETFWWATKEIKLDTVLMGINLNLYNKYNKKFWVQETIERRENFFSYAFNRYTLQATMLTLEGYLSDENVVAYEPPSSKEEFWRYTLSSMGSKFYEHFAYPDEYFAQLKEISEYCKRHDIVLIFWVPPTHIEFQKKKEDFGLAEMDARFKADLATMGEVYDFDYPSELTQKYEDFRDPMHFDVRVGEIVRDELLTGLAPHARHPKGHERTFPGGGG